MEMWRAVHSCDEKGSLTVTRGSQDRIKDVILQNAKNDDIHTGKAESLKGACVIVITHTLKTSSHFLLSFYNSHAHKQTRWLLEAVAGC